MPVAEFRCYEEEKQGKKLATEREWKDSGLPFPSIYWTGCIERGESDLFHKEGSIFAFTLKASVAFNSLTSSTFNWMNYGLTVKSRLGKQRAPRGSAAIWTVSEIAEPPLHLCLGCSVRSS